tara:strand:- start:239 stop:517 length:279 start_codon:yes stop_codon:yes gene_type:complete
MTDKPKVPAPVKAVLTALAKGTINTVEASGRIGTYLDKMFGTEDKTLFSRGAADRELRYGNKSGKKKVAPAKKSNAMAKGGMTKKTSKRKKY